MSNSDSFIDEVTEEVRRDRLYGYLRRYGWIGVLVIVLIVGGAAYTEWRRAQAEAQSQAVGDALISALSADDPQARAAALQTVDAHTPGALAAVYLITAAEAAAAEDTAVAVANLEAVATNGELPEIYRQIAGFKLLLVQSETLDVDERRAGFEDFAAPGNPLRLLAEEQLALIALEEGDSERAVALMQDILRDAETTSGLQQRALQVIVALGGEVPDTAPPPAEN